MNGIPSTHPLTSTLEPQQYHSSFNVWLVILIAIFFFLILSWYNVMLAIYNYLIGNNPNQVEDFDKINKFMIYATIGYAVLWTIIAIGIYYLFDYFRLLGNDKSVDTHPLLREDVARSEAEKATIR
jgi:hypothetical protein